MINTTASHYNSHFGSSEKDSAQLMTVYERQSGFLWHVMRQGFQNSSGTENAEADNTKWTQRTKYLDMQL